MTKNATTTETHDLMLQECSLPGATLKKITVIYEFKHSRMGFQNSITADAMGPNHAIENAKKAVVEVFGGIWGKNCLNKFTFKIGEPINKFK